MFYIIRRSFPTRTFEGVALHVTQHLVDKNGHKNCCTLGTPSEDVPEKFFQVGTTFDKLEKSTSVLLR